MPDGDTNENIRNLKRAYRKKSYQTGYAQKGDGVNSTPVPYSSYSTETSLATQPQRAGIDPATFKRPVRPSMENLELHPNNVDSASYPWHLVPKANSGNVIQRQVVNLNTIPDIGGAAAPGFLDSGEYVDLLVLNVNDGSILGTDTWTSLLPAFGGTINNPVPSVSQLPPSTAPNFDDVASVGVGSVPFTPASRGIQRGAPTAGGLPTGILTAGTNTITEVGGQLELYLISSFGHTQPTLNGAATPRYQIWVDGGLVFEWTNFQWAVVVPEADQWQFKMPLVVEKQIVFRLVCVDGGGGAGVDTLTGNVQACFTGWSEQQTGFTDVGRQALEGGV